MKIYPIIMSGGAGTRLWPLSRTKKPKQYHAIVTQNTMFAETLLRIRECNANNVADPIVICAEGHEALIQAQAAQFNIALTAVILEPFARNTAAVGAVAAEFVRRIDPEGLILLLPADHHIEDSSTFWEAIEKAKNVAAQGYLMALGIEPTRPDTGFGYIQRGKKIASDVYGVKEFKEKPDADTAEAYLETGNYSWNAGIFLFNLDRLIQEYQTNAVDIFSNSVAALDNAKLSGICYSLDKWHFSKCRSESIDIAIMEKTPYAAVVDRVNAGWNDIGSWAAISEFMAENSMEGPVSSREILMINSENCYVRSDGNFIATLGVKNLIVVATDGAVLVADNENTQDVKKIVDFLIKEKRDDLL